MKKKLSIIIPFYNSAHFLGDCINRVLKQITKNVEIVLINDHSIDSSNKIVKRYKNKNIKYINLKKNKGVAICRNLGIKAAKGEYILFLDSDDLLSKNAVSDILNSIRKFPNTEMFQLSFNKISNDKKILFDYNSKTLLKNKKKSLNNQSLLSALNFEKLNEVTFTAWQYVYKKKFLIKNNLFFKNLYISEDWNFVIEAQLLCFNYKPILKPLYNWRFLNANSHGKNTGYKTCYSLILILYYLSKLLSKNKKFNAKEKKNLVIFTNVTFRRFLNNFFSLNLINILKLIKFTNKYRTFMRNILFLKNTEAKLVQLSSPHFLSFAKNTITKKNIKINSLKKNINNNKILIFCASSYSSNIIKILNNLNLEIDYIIDNNTDFDGQKRSNITIKHFDFLKKKINVYTKYMILICHKNLNTIKLIKKQLRKLHINTNNIISVNNF